MSISSPNAVITITIPGVLTVGVRLQGFAADDIFDTDEIELGTVLMGVDGIQSAGYVNVSTPMNITFQADSPSILTFEAWIAAESLLQDKFVANANVTLTTLNRSYQLVNGALVRGKKLPDAKKTLMPRKFRIDWESVIPIPVGLAG